MSTSFIVYPTKSKIPKVKDLLELSENNINNFLIKNNINKNINLKINIHEMNEKYIKDILEEELFIFNDNEYAWLSIKNVFGGTDCYFEQIDDFDKDYLLNDIKHNNLIVNFDDKIMDVLRNNYYWSFRRSAGQPCIINLSYGLIASSLAELTDGLIWTDDGAWQYKIFPCFYHDFNDFFFNKNDLTNSKEDIDWSNQCLKGIIKELI